MCTICVLWCKVYIRWLTFAAYSGSSGDRYTVVIQPTETQLNITTMQRGTSYHVYLEAIFDKYIAGLTTYILKTWILIAATRGVGPDKRMFCLTREPSYRKVSERQQCVYEGPTAQHTTRRGRSHGQISTIKATQDAYGASWRRSGRWPIPPTGNEREERPRGKKSTFSRKHHPGTYNQTAHRSANRLRSYGHFLKMRRISVIVTAHRSSSFPSSLLFRR